MNNIRRSRAVEVGKILFFAKEQTFHRCSKIEWPRRIIATPIPHSKCCVAWSLHFCNKHSCAKCVTDARGQPETIASSRGVRDHDFKKRVLLNMSLALLASDIGANAAINERPRICIEHKPHFTFHMRVRMERAVIQVWMHLHREVLSSVENLQKQGKSSVFQAALRKCTTHERAPLHRILHEVVQCQPRIFSACNWSSTIENCCRKICNKPRFSHSAARAILLIWITRC